MEQQLHALAARLAARHVQAHFVFAGAPARWLDDGLTGAGARVRVLDFDRPLTAAARLATWLRKQRADLVHFHFVRAYSPLIAAARLAGAGRVIVQDHVTLTRGDANPLRAAYKRARTAALGRLVDRRVAVSAFVAASVREIEHVELERVAVIENGIDLDRFVAADGREVRAALAPDRPLLTCVSRLDAEKGVESAIRAMPYISGGGRRPILAIVGEGPMRAPWEALAASLGVGDAVKFLGLRDDVEQILAASDVVIVPSHWEEAFGLAVVEGMAAGKPVVVSRSGAMPAIVGDAGMVVPKRDPAALAGAVTRLLDDELLRERLGRLGRARAVARYGLDPWLARTLAVYDALCPHLALGSSS